MSTKTVKQLMNEIAWKRDQVIQTRDALLSAQMAHRDAGWKLDEAIQALADLAAETVEKDGE